MSQPKHQRIGLFGGTFDPPHVGHLVTAINVRHALNLDVVILMVSHDPWQKSGVRDVSPAADRFALVEAAVRNTILQLRGINTYEEFAERQRKAMQA